MDLPLLRLMTSLPRSSAPSDAQLQALRVLSDEWIDHDRRLGLLLAERLQCEVGEARALDLELDPGLATCDVRVLALRAPEVRELVMQLAREEDLHARLSNGWELDVFVRQHEFGRIDSMTSPDGFEVLIIDYAHGPLSLVRDYQPPPAIARDVYGLGLHARRRRMA